MGTICFYNFWWIRSLQCVINEYTKYDVGHYTNVARILSRSTYLRCTCVDSFFETSGVYSEQPVNDHVEVVYLYSQLKIGVMFMTTNSIRVSICRIFLLLRIKNNCMIDLRCSRRVGSFRFTSGLLLRF